MATRRGRLVAELAYAAVSGAVCTAREEIDGEVFLLVDPDPAALLEVWVVPSRAGWAGATVFVDLEADGWARTTLPVTTEARAVMPHKAWRWRAHVRSAEGAYTRSEWRE